MGKRKQREAVRPVAAAMATALCLAACGGKVIVDSVGGPDGLPSACAVACGTQNPKGQHYYTVVSSECLCTVDMPDACIGDCHERVCSNEEPPSDACLPCVKALLEGEQCKLQGLFGSGCFGHEECRAYVTCLEGC